jgi:hypothetical protein
MDGATISLCPAAGTAGTDAFGAATLPFSRCCGRATAAVKKTEAIQKRPAPMATLI